MKRYLTVVLAMILMNAGYPQFNNWHNLDLQKDKTFGISTEKAYSELLKNKNSKKVIVAIIDSGIDTTHEDLKSVLWIDAKTGAHGWNYIGPETGREDITRLIGDKKYFYDSLSHIVVPEAYRSEYQQFRKVAPVLNDKIDAMKNLIEKLTKYDTEDGKQIIDLAKYHLGHGLNINNIEPDTATGNADVSFDKIGPLPDPNLTPYHGTHVAGIIGAIRNNAIGMNGIADHVQLMILKTNGNIRELRDKSLADAIRFAVDHGAGIINISMGKPYTWNKKAVDSAVKYAMKNDVLIIHAAGNEGINIDKPTNKVYPNKYFADSSGQADAWITVGASGANDDNTLVAPFSNFGPRTVDVFAPGVQICSTIPGSKYDSWNGTSMAAPVVAGVAALIREYYPKLTAVQVKNIIMETSVKRNVLKDKCVSGGVVSAYNAILTAERYSKRLKL